MKKLVLFFLLTMGANAYAQNMMVVDSIKILPQNPTALDSVFLHIYWHSNYGCQLQSPPTVMNSGNSHTVVACYVVGLITIITSGDDSVFLFQGPAGIHVVSWQVTQNATQSTACDYTHAQNQATVNVLPTGIEEQSDALAMQWSSLNHELLSNTSGLLTIYGANGQLIYAGNIGAYERVRLEGISKQMYFATLRKADGEVSTLKFVVE